MFAFTCIATDRSARRGRLQTTHGTVETPAFMPVGTAGALKALTPADAGRAGVQMLLANTYHLSLRPGETQVKRAGGLHRFMGWSGPILTDSGGFQVFSLPKHEISDEGVRFRHEVDGSAVILTPERAVAIQEALGSDIAMVFDECVPYPCQKAAAERAVARTTAWARRSRDAHVRADQALFGICQGSTFQDLRRRSAEEIVALDFPGYAVGGVSVGEEPERMQEVVAWTVPHLPTDRPRYLMGVGNPEDIVQAIEQGIDLFDCVIPTRLARSGVLFTFQGRLRITGKGFRKDLYPPDTACPCYTCATFSRSYLYHLFHAHEILGPMLATIHNVTFYQDLVRRAREAIEGGRYQDFRQGILSDYRRRQERAEAAPLADDVSRSRARRRGRRAGERRPPS